MNLFIRWKKTGLLLMEKNVDETRIYHVMHSICLKNPQVTSLIMGFFILSFGNEQTHAKLDNYLFYLFLRNKQIILKNVHSKNYAKNA